MLRIMTLFFYTPMTIGNTINPLMNTNITKNAYIQINTYVLVEMIKLNASMKSNVISIFF
jgi:hypothetical protein